MDRLFAKGDTKAAYKILPRVIDISQEMARQLIEALIENNVDYIVAPYEADAQISYLIRNGFAHFAISEDSDLILYGCDYVLYKLDKDLNGVLFCNSELFDCLGDEAEKFDFRKFKRMCILSGCDYVQNLTGIGLMKAKKFFSTITSTSMERILPCLPRVLKMKNLVVPKEYVEKFIQAENVFDHQLVFCPRSKKLRPFSDYSENHVKEKLDFAGSYFDENLALNLTLGNVWFKTMEIIDNSLIEKLEEKYFKSTSSIWNESYKLEDPNRFDKIRKKLEPTYSRPNELLGKRKFLEEDDKKDKKRKSSDEDESVIESSLVSNTSYNSDVNNSINTSTRSVSKSSHDNEFKVKSRFFNESLTISTRSTEKQNDVQRIIQSRKEIRDRLSKLYPKKISSSQASSDSGFGSQSQSNSQQSQ